MSGTTVVEHSSVWVEDEWISEALNMGMTEDLATLWSMTRQLRQQWNATLHEVLNPADRGDSSKTLIDDALTTIENAILAYGPRDRFVDGPIREPAHRRTPR